MATRSTLLLSLLLIVVFADTFTLLVADPDPPPSTAPAPAPWADPVGRKLGRHEFLKTTPGMSPTPEETVLHSSTSSSSAIDWKGEAAVVTRAQSQDSHPSHHHKEADKSVAGGGVILGGLGTMFLVVVFVYIRATGRHKAQTTAASA